ncbi:phage head closure protein [Pelagibacterium mangrovi]|uniref:phage head closure protein n=1 Tax=Pelagibacterium mangrovi TaxID=3119828 RepID=UPI002FCB34E6
MDAGDLDRRITLHKAGEPQGEDDFGNPIPGEDINLTRWAEYLPVSDRERLAAMEVSASYTARFRIRWSQAVKSVDPTWRLTFEGRVYDISGVKELGRREGIEITASARAEAIEETAP